MRKPPSPRPRPSMMATSRMASVFTCSSVAMTLANGTFTATPLATRRISVLVCLSLWLIRLDGEVLE